MADTIDLLRAWCDRSPMATRRTAAPPPAASFDRLYATSSDPWGYDSSYYEHHRHRLALMTPRERYRAVHEPGCATRGAQQLLARRCDRLVSTDHPSRLARARTRLAAFPHVECAARRCPRTGPTSAST